MNNAEKALQEWIKTQSLPVSDVEEHGFINGYNWAMKKTLTDEEILEIRHKYRTKLVDGNYRVDELEFARAILRKAQEK